MIRVLYELCIISISTLGARIEGKMVGAPSNFSATSSLSIVELPTQDRGKKESGLITAYTNDMNCEKP
jgi:hypothetical protein